MAQSIIQGHVADAKPRVVDGNGVYVTIEDPVTKERKTLLDGATGAAVGILGYKDSEIIEAMAEAAKTSIYNFPLYMSNYAAEELAQFLIDNSPKDAFSTALITCSGSESIENTLKLAYQYQKEVGQPQRTKFVSRNRSYHGYTLGALSIGDSSRADAFKPILGKPDQFIKVSAVYPYRHMKAGETLEQYKDRLVKEVEDTFIANDPSTIAAYIGETVGGSTFGTCPPVPGYLEGVRAVCHKYGVLFVLDEVMCGIGRCGTFHAWEQFLPEGQSPDIQTIGKTLGGGYVTVAAILVSPKVTNAITKGSNNIIGAQTYHQHAFNSSVALAVQKKVKREGVVANIHENGNFFGEQLKKQLLGKSKTVGDVRGAGGFWSIELVKDVTTKETFPVDFHYYSKLYNKITENGAITMPSGGTADNLNGDHILFSPSLNISKEDTQKLLDIVVKSVFELEAELNL
ncbi:hypothetical protein DASC09_048640 [Saccharomycopsis crataegensis]|uniref:Aminotransferase n=1 Tax=Saccharomycopsis crataegensis TaxID=43959 RepID=A0AAV5QS25_9ASCO|nr:hypothetical protein DASC09_048640 [Saccharomycopsis crataegensis]